MSLVRCGCFCPGGYLQVPQLRCCVCVNAEIAGYRIMITHLRRGCGVGVSDSSSDVMKRPYRTPERGGYHFERTLYRGLALSFNILHNLNEKREFLIVSICTI